MPHEASPASVTTLRSQADVFDADDFWCDCTGCVSCCVGDHWHCAEFNHGPCGMIAGHEEVSQVITVPEDPAVLDQRLALVVF